LYYEAVAKFHKFAQEPFFHELTEEERIAFIKRRSKMLAEEVDELSAEMRKFADGQADAVGIAMEAADVLYIIFGTVQLMGIPIEAVFHHIHERNLRKVDGSFGEIVRRPDGKILKPKGWTPITRDEMRNILWDLYRWKSPSISE